ncbi:hypothetical protein WQE_08527 [Paraburkholderia hospita]|uniref:Uncharacterized protein n=1 Tax=Paraburkholderia hospita TaxID=169430 RepID=A0ABN0FRZ0_9BURK|nr:hypothetical protein WQE_08527 [Paraburkholderia hospita]OUL70267.1 hypothetical protein CA602_48360 [Paraburkholderia hospita]
MDVEVMEHPNTNVVRIGLSETSASPQEQHVTGLLVAWAISVTPSLPGLAIEEACTVAERLHNATVSMFSDIMDNE